MKATHFLMALTALVLGACANYATKEDLKAFVPLSGDIARACLNQCPGQAVDGWQVEGNRLVCQCSKLKTAKK